VKAIFSSPGSYADWKTDMADYSHTKATLAWSKQPIVKFRSHREKKKLERAFNPVNQEYVDPKRVTSFL